MGWIFGDFMKLPKNLQDDPAIRPSADQDALGNTRGDGSSRDDLKRIEKAGKWPWVKKKTLGNHRFCSFVLLPIGFFVVIPLFGPITQ